MSAYMTEHGCSSLLVADEIEAAKQGVLVHWRDLNGHWFSASYQPSEGYFAVDEG